MKSSQAPEVSVVLPVLNAANTLEESVRSILHQNRVSLEVIVIDDGSTDTSLDILHKIASQDSRVKLVSRPNKGLVETLNEGIRLARGKWIARMDADDISTEDRIYKQLAHLRRTGAHFCGGWVKLIGARRGSWQFPESDEACKIKMLFDVPFAHPTVVGSTEAFRQLGYRENHHCAEDYDLWVRAADAGYKFTNLQECILQYRISDSQISSANRDRQQTGAREIKRALWTKRILEFSDSEVPEIINVVSCNDGRTGRLLPEIDRFLGSISNKEAQEVFLFGVFRIFCKMASRNRLSPYHWVLLNKHRWTRRASLRLVILIFISTTRLRTETGFILQLRRFFEERFANDI